MGLPTFVEEDAESPVVCALGSRHIFVVGNVELNRVDRGLHPQGSNLVVYSEIVQGVSHA